jgi:hypothetical protein
MNNGKVQISRFFLVWAAWPINVIKCVQNDHEQGNTVQYSTVQYSTPVQYSTAQYSKDRNRSDVNFLYLFLSPCVQPEEDGDEDPTPGERTHRRRLRQLHPHGSRGQGRQAPQQPPPGQGRQAPQQPPPGQAGGP